MADLKVAEKLERLNSNIESLESSIKNSSYSQTRTAYALNLLTGVIALVAVVELIT